MENVTVLYRTKKCSEISQLLGDLHHVTLYDRRVTNVINKIRNTTFTKSGEYEFVLVGDKSTHQVILHVPGEQLRNGKDINIVLEDLTYKRRWFFFDWRICKVYQ